MNMTEVVELCRELHVKGVPGPYGVSFSWFFDHGCLHKNGKFHFRIENGSGIAGRGNAWNVYELPAGPTLGPKVTTKRELRPQILAAIAEGARPADRDGYETYARWHTYGMTGSVQWFQRRQRRPRLAPLRRRTARS